MISSKKQSISLTELISIILLGYISVCSVFPPLKTIGNATWLKLIALVIWMFFAFIKDKDFFLNVSLYKAAAYFFSLYVIIMPIFLGTQTYSNRYAALILFSLGPIIYMFYKKQGDFKVIKVVVAITLFFSLITFFLTAKALINNPSVSRSIGVSDEYTFGLYKEGVGGYEFVYHVCVLSIIMLTCFFLSKVKYRGILLAIWIVSFGFVIMSNYMTAFVLLVFSSLLVFLFCIEGKKRYTVFFAGLIVVVLIIVFGANIKDLITDFVKMISPSGKTAMRFSRMEGSLIEGIKNEFLRDRSYTLSASIDELIKHPVLGLAGVPSSLVDGTIVGAGQHSHILDTFCFFGVLIGIINCYLLIAPIFWDLYDKRIAVPFAVCYIGILFFNNASPALAITAYIIMPYMFSTFCVVQKDDMAEQQE